MYVVTLVTIEQARCIPSSEPGTRVTLHCCQSSEHGELAPKFYSHHHRSLRCSRSTAPKTSRPAAWRHRISLDRTGLTLAGVREKAIAWRVKQRHSQVPPISGNCLSESSWSVCVGSCFSGIGFLYMRLVESAPLYGQMGNDWQSGGRIGDPVFLPGRR